MKTKQPYFPFCIPWAFSSCLDFSKCVWHWPRKTYTTTGRTARPTAEESYEPEADGYDVEPPTVNDATSSEAISSVRNQDIRHNENDGDGGST